MNKSKLLGYILIPLSVVLIIFLGIRGLYMLQAYSLLLFVLILFFIDFEHRSSSTHEIVLIAALAAIAAVGRTIFSPIPSAQPTSFIIISVACVFGGRTGFIVGALSAFVSNVFLGQGPWTVWQMVAWGSMGYFSGLIFHTFKMNNIYIKITFGFIAGILFGWFMNLWFLTSATDGISLAKFITACVASGYMDLIHGVSNVIFIALFAKSLEKTLTRMKTKYGIFMD